jgi:AcrR family transcriptional regulator
MMTDVSSLSPTDDDVVARRPGRPRDARADRAILEATLELAAAEGLAGFSVDAVAQRAGVSKATIYRRWSSKEQMVVEAIHELAVSVEVPDTGSLRGDLDALYGVICQGMQQGPASDLMAQVVLAAKTNPEVAALLRETLAERRRPLRGALERAVERGELPAGTDLGVAMDLLTGPVFFRFLVTREGVDQRFLDCIRDVVVEGLEKGRCG